MVCASGVGPLDSIQHGTAGVFAFAHALRPSGWIESLAAVQISSKLS